MMMMILMVNYHVIMSIDVALLIDDNNDNELLTTYSRSLSRKKSPVGVVNTAADLL